MRATIGQLLAPAICLGLFIVTCPLTAQSVAPEPEQPKCCSLSEIGSECAVSEHDGDDSDRCCVTHDCGSVIAARAASSLLPRLDAPCVGLNFTERTAERGERPPVPPPRGADA
jgi:hypothetical protein